MTPQDLFAAEIRAAIIRHSSDVQKGQMLEILVRFAAVGLDGQEAITGPLNGELKVSRFQLYAVCDSLSRVKWPE